MSELNEDKVSTKPAIFIIDDDNLVTDSLGFSLKKKYDVYISNEIQDASEQLVKREFPVILIDYNLQERINGLQFSSHIKNLFPESKIVLMTGVKDFNLVKTALNEGNIDFIIHKPLHLQKLNEIIDLAITKYGEKQSIKAYLENPLGLENARSVVEQLLMGSRDDMYPFQLNGLVISQQSIPVFSHFYPGNVLKNLNETLFAGFMNALVLVGDEVFSRSKGVESLVFGHTAIYFRFVKDYQISFILSIPEKLQDSNLARQLNKFADSIQLMLEEDPTALINAHDSDRKIHKLLKGLKKRLNAI